MHYLRQKLKYRILLNFGFLFLKHIPKFSTNKLVRIYYVIFLTRLYLVLRPKARIAIQSLQICLMKSLLISYNTSTDKVGHHWTCSLPPSRLLRRAYSVSSIVPLYPLPSSVEHGMDQHPRLCMDRLRCFQLRNASSFTGPFVPAALLVPSSKSSIFRVAAPNHQLLSICPTQSGQSRLQTGCCSFYMTYSQRAAVFLK